MHAWKRWKRFAVLAAFLLMVSALPAAAQKPHEIHFNLHPFAKFLPCITNPNDDAAPRAKVEVERGRLNDTLELELKHFKPGLAFDLFTVERSRLLANGTPDPSFHGFGLSWYQSDVQVNEGGEAHVKIRTILLDQIFGFVDPATTGQLEPTNTFHVGFWFNDPADAAACGFTGFTPFNGEHHAGPVAMISVPDPVTGLGPLCTHPDTSVTPARCNP
jgi:hypothetical protein